VCACACRVRAGKQRKLHRAAQGCTGLHRVAQGVLRGAWCVVRAAWGVRHLPCAREQHVGRLDVAVDLGLAVQVLEPLEHLLGLRARLRGRLRVRLRDRFGIGVGLRVRVSGQGQGSGSGQGQGQAQG